jgi:hypothetical protein
MAPNHIEARVVQRITARDYVTLAYGRVGGRAAGRFLRSFVTPEISVECSEDGTRWRWVYVKRRGGSVSRVHVY